MVIRHTGEGRNPENPSMPNSAVVPTIRLDVRLLGNDEGAPLCMGLLPVPAVSGGRPGVFRMEHLGKLGERALHGSRMQPDAIESQVGVVGGDTG